MKGVSSQDIIIHIKSKRVRILNKYGITGSNLYNLSNCTLRKMIDDLELRWEQTQD